MKKFILLLALFSLTAAAQVELLWQKSAQGANLPSWFSSGNLERGFTYYNNKLYVVSRNTGTFVRIVDAANGNDAGQLVTSGLAGGTFLLNDIEASSDGMLFGCNLVNDAAGIFKIYRWRTETDTPKVMFANDFGGAKRVGDNFTVIGSYAQNTLSVWCCDVPNNKVYILKKAPAADSLVLSATINLPAGTLGSAASVYPVPADSMIVVKSAGKYVQAYTFAGVLKDEIPGTIVGSGATTVRLFDLNQRTFIAVFQYPTANVRILDTQGDNASYFRTFNITETLGGNPNVNGTGDIAYYYNPDGTVTMFVLATNNGFAAYKVLVPYMVNGRFHEDYTTLAEAQNNNNGFGPNVLVKKVHYKMANNKLYVALESRLDKANDNGVAVFLNISKLNGQGAAAGTSLGAVTGGGHAFGNVTNPNFKNDFETHYAFIVNPGAGDSMVYVDAAKYTAATKQGMFIGKTKQDGSGAQGPAAAGIFSANAITFAFDTAYGKNRGFEFSVPLSEIGNPSANDRIMAFAAVVSSTAYFSNVTVPGNLGSSNPGFNPNFVTLPGGPFHSNSMFLPVELSGFSAAYDGAKILLNWSTASELNNRGFEIERSVNGEVFVPVGFIAGNGNSSASHSYSFSDVPSSAGLYFYRLKQIDFNGSSEYSRVLSVSFDAVPAAFALSQNFPNPFNPETGITFTLPASAPATLKVFTVLGTEVATLFNETAEAGKSYSVTFNASGLASGTYFYRLEQGGASISRKMSVLK